MTAEIIVIVQNQDARPGMLFAIEVCRRQATDATANDHEVVSFARIDRLSCRLQKHSVAHSVGDFIRPIVAIAHAGEQGG